jgi:hypothetical protein
MANIKDFAVGTVKTAPSPATTGVTLELQAGEAARMPAVPFYATATPPGQLTTLDTSEKILVTAKDTTTNIITFTRAQAPTTAMAIGTNWIISNSIYTDDVTSSSIALNQTPTGTINGTNPTFTLAAPATSIVVYKNGVRMSPGSGNDYVFSNNNTITFESGAIPATGAVVRYDAIIGATIMLNGSNSIISDETPAGTVNGTNAVFTAVRGYVGGSLEVYINGIKQARGAHFTETSPSAGTFTMGDAPLTGDIITINYQFAAAASANADTVDNYHASATPTAGTLLPLDSNSRIKPSAIGINYVDSNFTVQGARFSTTSATYADIPGISMAYTAGPTNERLMLVASLMAQKVAGAEGNIQLTCNGVPFGPELYYNPNTSDWVRGVINCFIPLAAGQTITLKLQARAISGGTFYVINETSKWMPKFTGLVWAE